MKGRIFVVPLLCGALLLLSAVGGFAQKKGAPVAWPAEDIKWMAMKDGPPGLMYANLWGDMMKGAYGALVKLPAGGKHPLHTHSADTKLVVISGTFLYTPENGTEKRLGPGSYLMVPANSKHSSGIGEDGPCEVFQQSTGKFDMHPVGEPKM